LNSESTPISGFLSAGKFSKGIRDDLRSGDMTMKRLMPRQPQHHHLSSGSYISDSDKASVFSFKLIVPMLQTDGLSKSSKIPLN